MAGPSMVARLVASPPRRLSELEAIVGRIDMSFARADQENRGFLVRPRIGEQGVFTSTVTRLSVNYAYDMYHQDPERPRDVELTDWTMIVRGRRKDADIALCRLYGAPQRAWDRDREYSLHHPFYVSCRTADDYLLEWHREMPRWAIPVPEDAVRRAWVEGFRDVLATAHTVDDLESYCRSAPTEAAGVEVVGTLNRRLNQYAEFAFPHDDARDFHLRFSPPIPASAIVEAFDLHPAVGHSTDVHMATWNLERDGDGRPPVVGALQHWQLEARLTSHARGPAVAPRGPNLPRLLDGTEEVGHLGVRPRFR